MNWSFINILMLFGAIQGFILVLILIFKKTNNKKARLYLSIILFALSMNLLYYFFSLGGAAKMLPVIDLVYIPWSLLAAVSFYLYIAFISPFQKKLTLLNKLGFVPFLLFSIVIGTTSWYNFLSLPEQQINNAYISLLAYY